MGIINKIFSSVNGLYNNINPITLSGVNDVIVVRGADGALRCSPFQLRFSKLNFYNNRAKTVNLYVNGRLTDITMTITNHGDLFFAQQRANDRVDYEKVVEYLHSDEVSIEAILATRIVVRAGKTKKLVVAYEELSAHEPGAAPRRASDDAGPYASAADELVAFQEGRLQNLTKRLFYRNSRTRYYDDFYSVLAAVQNKMTSLLTSAEHYANLLKKQKLLLYLLEQLIGSRPADECGVALSFSSCMGCKIERSVGETFVTYLTKDIEDPDNTVVRIEALLPGKRTAGDAPLRGPLDALPTRLKSVSLDSLAIRLDAAAAPLRTRLARFYLPFKVFAKLFFEVRQARNRMGTLAAFLEKEHNEALGWNLFGSRQPIKNDIGFSLELDSAELASLGLSPGKNDVVFKIGGQQRQLEGNIYLWEASDKIVVSDIDGTITKSDILGHLCNLVGKDWTHNGVAALFTKIVANGYKIVYLTSRSLSQSSATRSYLRTVSQGAHRLPDGPIIHSPDGLFGALYREVIVKRPEEFKIHCLSVIKELFGGKNPFLAGFGNRINDAYTYKVLDIPNNRIYTINPEGQLIADYTKSLVGTYHTMNEFIDSIFPPLVSADSTLDSHAYSDFSWWR